MCVQLLASCEKLLRVCDVLQSYCTVSTNKSTLGSTDRSTEEVPVGAKKVWTLFLARTVFVNEIGHFSESIGCATDSSYLRSNIEWYG